MYGFTFLAAKLSRSIKYRLFEPVTALKERRG
jgi:hypothetical protein